MGKIKAQLFHGEGWDGCDRRASHFTWGASSEPIHQSCALWTESVSCTQETEVLRQQWESLLCPVPEPQGVECRRAESAAWSHTWSHTTTCSGCPVWGLHPSCSTCSLGTSALETPARLPGASGAFISWSFHRLMLLSQFTC